MDSMTSFSKLFKNKKFYNSVMEEIARQSYKYLRSMYDNQGEIALGSDSMVAETKSNLISRSL